MEDYFESLNKAQIEALIVGLTQSVAYQGYDLPFYVSGGAKMVLMGDRVVAKDIDAACPHEDGFQFWGAQEQVAKKLGLLRLEGERLHYKWLDGKAEPFLANFIADSARYFTPYTLLDGRGPTVYLLNDAVQVTMKLHRPYLQPKDCADLSILCPRVGITSEAGLRANWYRYAPLIAYTFAGKETACEPLAEKWAKITVHRPMPEGTGPVPKSVTP
jgi:hypothetical protein